MKSVEEMRKLQQEEIPAHKKQGKNSQNMILEGATRKFTKMASLEDALGNSKS